MPGNYFMALHCVALQSFLFPFNNLIFRTYVKKEKRKMVIFHVVFIFPISRF